MNNLDQLDDTTLMQRFCRHHDNAAFGTLVSRHQKLLLNFFNRWGVQNDSEDLVQQTFLRLYNYRDKYVATAQLKTFLLLLARQVQIDDLRRRKSREAMLEKLAAQPRPEFVAPPRRSAGVAGDVDLADALATLPEALRQVVELGVYQDLPYADVAKILEIPVGTVKSRMFNALAKLRDYLKERP